jgi:hypothetical protein
MLVSSTFALSTEQSLRPRELAEIDVPGELADDHEIEPGDDLGLERRCRGELGIEQRGAQVGEEAERLADAEDPLLGPRRARQRVPLGATDGPEQHGVGALREREGGLGKWTLRGVEARAADQRRAGLDGKPFAPEDVEHADGLADDFRTDAVTRQDGDFHRDRRQPGARSTHAWCGRSVAPRGPDAPPTRATALRRDASPRTRVSHPRAAA